MNHHEILERLDQACSARIDKLFWIGGQHESSELKDFIDYNLDEKEWKKMFPKLAEKEWFNEVLDGDAEEKMQALFDMNYLGFCAEVHIPECSNFRFKKDKPVSWSSSGGICRVEYEYGETLEELVSNIEKTASRVFAEYVKKFKAKAVKP